MNVAVAHVPGGMILQAMRCPISPVTVCVVMLVHPDGRDGIVVAPVCEAVTTAISPILNALGVQEVPVA